MRRRREFLSRRDVLAGLGGLVGALAWPWPEPACGQPGTAVALRLGAGEATLRGAAPASPIWDFVGSPLPRLTQGDVLDVALTNDLPVAALLNWRSCDGAAAAEPLLAQRPLPPGQSSTMRLTFGHAGTVLCDARLFGDGQPLVLPAQGFVVGERRPPAVDADHLVTITDWRIRPDGALVAPGQSPADATTVFTANGTADLDIPARRHARLRVRFINACHRSAIAIKLENHDLRVMAIDGQPAAPFVARDGQLMLAAGARIDTFVDATAQPRTSSTLWLHDGLSPRLVGRLVYDDAEPLRRAPLPPPPPLESNGLPERLMLTAAQRFELAVDARPGANAPGWQRPEAFTAGSPLAFRVKRGGTAVLALVNRGPTPVTFRLHGHHVRWLDRLDDGWKPFWLDTLLLPGGQTIRVAFAAEHAGAWMLEIMGTDWEMPRLVGWYAVE